MSEMAPIITGQQTLNFRPKARVLESIAARGGRAYQAICEFVDNSIDSALKSDMTEVSVAINYQSKQGNIVSITIADNAFGMSANDLEKALTLGDSNKPGTAGQIGRFGMGMKTSLGFLGDRWKITTATIADMEALHLDLSLSKLVQDDNFEATAYHIPKPRPHGTTITITDCRKINAVSFERDLQEHLPSIFRHFLADGFLKLSINGKLVEHKEFDLLRVPGTYLDLDFIVGKHRITGWIGLRQSTSSPNYGFDLVKNRRVIVPHSHVAIGNDPALNRVVGELFLDGFTTDHQKSGFDESDPQWEAMVKQLTKLIKPVLEKARELTNKANTKNDRLVEAALPNLLKQLNDIIRNDEVLKDLFSGERKAGTTGVNVATTDKEKVEREPSDRKNTTPREKKDKPNVVGNLKITHHTMSQGKEARRKTWEVNGSEMVIITNSDHPLYPAQSEKRLRYVMMNTLESMAHYSANEEVRREELNSDSQANVDKYEDILERIVRGAVTKGVIN